MPLLRFLTLALLLEAVTAHTAAREPIPAPRLKGRPVARTDLELIQGTWDIVGLETGGNSEDARNYRGNTLTFAKLKGADAATLQEGKLDPIVFNFTLNPANSPKPIDLVLTTPARGVTFRGIYKLDGDDLTICVGNGGARPAEFVTRAGGDTETFTLKRDRWVHVADADSGFAVEMPAEPLERRRNLDTAAGATPAKFLVARSEAEPVVYVVGVARLPGKLNGKEAEAAMVAARNAAVEEAYPGAKVREEKKVPPKAKDAVQEYTVPLDVPDSKDRAAARVRQFVAGSDRLYVLVAAGSEDAIRPETLARFANSFRPAAPKKGTN